jgi:hypothetical protein
MAGATVKDVIFLLLALALVVSIFIVWSHSKLDKETFAEETTSSLTEDVLQTHETPEESVQNHIVNIFNLMLNRNPSAEEIERYTQPEDQDLNAISERIMRDHS